MLNDVEKETNMNTEVINDQKMQETVEISLALPPQYPPPEQQPAPKRAEVLSPEQMRLLARTATAQAIAAVKAGECFDVRALDPRDIGPETCTLIRQIIKYGCIIE
ncbi:MAG TPA: hypothetical protein VF733_06770 [Candidatus Saccharimonadales bacterium]